VRRACADGDAGANRDSVYADASTADSHDDSANTTARADANQSGTGSVPRRINRDPGTHIARGVARNDSRWRSRPKLFVLRSREFAAQRALAFCISRLKR
jgi:hypothetical protein